MSIEIIGPGALDYLPCRYGMSKLLFRGPRRQLAQPYIAFLGGTETYGKFIVDPFPALLEAQLDQTCVNFGLLNAGIDAFVQDTVILEAAAKAEITVIQVVGAQNLSNRFYAVHPRRNDRFVSASSLLRTIYGDVDFADFTFTRHMLGHLQKVSPDRFRAVRAELQQAWLARMRLMLGQIPGKKVLLWLSVRRPEESVTQDPDGLPLLGEDPLFVTREMLDALSPKVSQLVEVCVDPEAVGADTTGMVFSEVESMAARQVMGPAAHAAVTQALLPVLQELAGQSPEKKARR